MKIGTEGLSLTSSICLGAGLVLSGLLALGVYQDEELRIHKEFVRKVDMYASAINEQLAENIAILHSIRALFNASEAVTRAEFHAFSIFLLERYPTMKAVGWVPRVTAAERDAFEARIQAEGLAEGIIMEGGVGCLVSAAAREEYYPVYYIEPVENNEAAFLFDLASNPERRAALRAARDTGKARSSSRIKLVQEVGNVWSVLIFVPVYEGLPGGLEDRRKSIQGVVSGVFRIPNLIQTAIMHLPGTNDVNLELYDELPDENLELLYSSAIGESRLANSFTYEKVLKPTGGRQWHLMATPTAAYIAGQRTLLPYISFLAGALITLSLTYYMSLLIQQRKRVERQVEARTQELRLQQKELTEANEHLKEEVEERRLLQERFAEVTDQEQRRFGQELHDSLGQQIAVAAMLSQNLQKRLEAAGVPEAEHLSRLTETTKVAQAQIRALSKGLLPVKVGSGGLQGALADLVKRVKEGSDVAMKFNCNDTVVVHDARIATQLYRISQEALRNALEHGEVSRVTITLYQGVDALTLTIRDNGTGFADAASTSSGSGVSIMNHRADLIGATLTISSEDEGGAVVVCRVPQAGSSRADT